jgi:hypothetical protein
MFFNKGNRSRATPIEWLLEKDEHKDGIIDVEILNILSQQHSQHNKHCAPPTPLLAFTNI